MAERPRPVAASRRHPAHAGHPAQGQEHSGEPTEHAATERGKGGHGLPEESLVSGALMAVSAAG